MIKKICFVVFLFLSCIYLSAQVVDIYSNGELKGVSRRIYGEKGGSSVSLLESNADKNLNMSFSGHESWVAVFFDFKRDSINTEIYRYLSFKIRTDSSFLLEEIGLGESLENSERVKKVIVSKDWNEYILKLPPKIRFVKTPLVIVSKQKGNLEINEVKYLSSLSESSEDKILLLPSPYKRLEDAKYIFSEQPEFGFPSGYSGEKNGASLVVDDHCMYKPYKGKYCLKIHVNDQESWRALFFQVKGGWTTDLGANTKLESLEEYNKLVFYARSDEKGFVIPKVGFGASGSSFNQESRSKVYVKLSKEWKRYELDIRGLDRSSVNDVLFFELGEGTFYLDEIRFEK